MKKNKTRTIAIIIGFLFISSIFICLSSSTLAEVRNVDLIRVFATGALFSAFVILMRRLLTEKNGSGERTQS